MGVRGVWGLCGEAGEKIRGHIVLTNFERVPVGVPSCPAGIVPSSIAHVPVPELAARVAELDTSSQELGCEGVR